VRLIYEETKPLTRLPSRPDKAEDLHWGLAPKGYKGDATEWHLLNGEIHIITRSNITIYDGDIRYISSVATENAVLLDRLAQPRHYERIT